MKRRDILQITVYETGGPLTQLGISHRSTNIPNVPAVYKAVISSCIRQLFDHEPDALATVLLDCAELAFAIQTKANEGRGEKVAPDASIDKAE